MDKRQILPEVGLVVVIATLFVVFAMCSVIEFLVDKEYGMFIAFPGALLLGNYASKLARDFSENLK